MQKISSLFFTVVLLSVFSIANAQCPLSVAEMEKIVAKTLPELDKDLAKKGYVLQKDRSGDNFKTYHCKKFKSAKTKDEVFRGADPSGNPDLTYKTLDKQQNQNMVADLKKRYKFLQELPFQINSINTKQQLYAMEGRKYLATTYSYTDADKLTWYCIVIRKVG